MTKKSKPIIKKTGYEDTNLPADTEGWAKLVKNSALTSHIEEKLKSLEAVINACSNEILRIKNDHYWPHHNGARIDHICDYTDERFDKLEAKIRGIVNYIQHHEEVMEYTIDDAIDECEQELAEEKEIRDIQNY